MTFDPSDRRRDRAAHIDVPYPPPSHDREAGRVRRSAPVSLADSYLTQQLRLSVDSAGLDVIPTASQGTGDLPVPGPVHVVSAWSPGGRPETLARNVAAGERLRHHLAAMAVDHRPVVAFAPDRSWAEVCVLLEGMSDEGATGLGRLLGQAAVVRLDASGVHVLPTGLVDLTPVSSPGWVVRPARTTCPMRRDGAAGERCRRQGGPYVSRSMEVALVWERHRELLTGMLGCGVCGDGAQPALGVGSPIGLVDLYVTNRYGGWQFG